MSPVPIIQSVELAETPSIFLIPQTSRQPRRKESFKKISRNVSVAKTVSVVLLI